MIWTILGIISLILLVIYFGAGRNAVWGGLTIGLLVSFIIAIFFIDKFDWSIIQKGAIIGTLSGFGAELLAKIPKLIFKQ